jgi:hypothetical protein
VSSADDGATWDGNVLDDDAANLPTGNICFVCTPIETNAETNSLLIIGTHDGQTKIWRKVEENAAGSQDQPWAFYPPDQYNKHPLPILANLQVISYDNVLLALSIAAKTKGSPGLQPTAMNCPATCPSTKHLLL